jgi:hypothetical protein
MERRGSSRYPLSLRAVIYPNSGSTILQTARTNNISSAGVYLLVEKKFVPDESFDLTLSFQTEECTEVQFRTTAKVVRTEACSGYIGVAAKISPCAIMRVAGRMGNS